MRAFACVRTFREEGEGVAAGAAGSLAARGSLGLPCAIAGKGGGGAGHVGGHSHRTCRGGVCLQHGFAPMARWSIDPMGDLALLALSGAVGLVAAVVAFVAGRRSGRAQELAEQRRARASAEETAGRLLDEARREAETLRKDAVVSGKEEVLRQREVQEQELRRLQPALGQALLSVEEMPLSQPYNDSVQAGFLKMPHVRPKHSFQQLHTSRHPVLQTHDFY